MKAAALDCRFYFLYNNFIMKNKLKYFEDIKATKVELNIDKTQIFSFASKTSIHSEVTDWAYGEVLKRECFDLATTKSLI